jgi:hypothetical protein
MSHNLRQLSESLRRNAETILLDVRRAHRALTTKLDDADPSSAEAPRAGSRPLSDTAEPDFGDVPEFIPATPRRAGR